MCTGLDVIFQRAFTNKAVDIANRILIIARLAAITRDELLSAVTEAMELIPTIAAPLPVLVCNQVVFIRWASSAIIAALRDYVRYIFPPSWD